MTERTLAAIETALASANKNYAAAVEAKRLADGEETRTRGIVNDLQRELDETLAKMRKGATWGTHWSDSRRAQGVPNEA